MLLIYDGNRILSMFYFDTEYYPPIITKRVSKLEYLFEVYNATSTLYQNKIKLYYSLFVRGIWTIPSTFTEEYIFELFELEWLQRPVYIKNITWLNMMKSYYPSLLPKIKYVINPTDNSKHTVETIRTFNLNPDFVFECIVDPWYIKPLIIGPIQDNFLDIIRGIIDLGWKFSDHTLTIIKDQWSTHFTKAYYNNFTELMLILFDPRIYPELFQMPISYEKYRSQSRMVPILRRYIEPRNTFTIYNDLDSKEMKDVINYIMDNHLILPCWQLLPYELLVLIFGYFRYINIILPEDNFKAEYVE